MGASVTCSWRPVASVVRVSILAAPVPTGVTRPLRIDLAKARAVPSAGSALDGSACAAQAFGGASAMIDNFLAVPGSAVYDQMHSGAWEYRIVRAERR